MKFLKDDNGNPIVLMTPEQLDTIRELHDLVSTQVHGGLVWNGLFIYHDLGCENYITPRVVCIEEEAFKALSGMETDDAR